jgi:hypothetical protein
MIVRDLPTSAARGPSSKDATSPRGFPGPVIDAGAGADPFVDDALALLLHLLRDHGIVSAFVRLHPLLGPAREALERKGRLVAIGESVSIDLGLSDSELWSRMRLNHRRDILRAARSGYTARIDDDWRHFDAFVRAYEESMVRVGAQPEWRVGRAYFADLREALGDHLHLCVVEVERALAAACLLTEADRIAEYHAAGTFDAHVTASPSKLLIHFAQGWARARGHHTLHLAGTPIPGDSLSRFKAGFSQLRHTMHTWRIIADAPAYDRLTRAWEQTTGVAADPPDGFFPAYRKPAAQTARGGRA